MSGLSRLKRIQQCGADGGCVFSKEFTWTNTDKGYSGNVTSYHLPVNIYDYQDIWVGDNENGGCAACGYNVEVKTGDFVDVNNDTLPDYVMSYRNEQGTPFKRIYKNTGSAFVNTGFEPPVTMRDYFWLKGRSPARGEMLQTSSYADVNGDGWTDIIKSFKAGYTVRRDVHINDQTGFSWKPASASSFIPPTSLWNYDILGEGKPFKVAYLTDLNGDGRVDWVKSFINVDGVPQRATYINNGTNWVANQNYELPPGAYLDDYRRSQNIEGLSVKRTEFVDINGDGLVDLVQGLLSPDQGVDAGKTYRKVWLNTGLGWQGATATYQLPDYISDYTRINSRDNKDLVQRRGSFIDVNGDGLVDWVQSYRDGANYINYKKTWLNSGKGWREDPNYVLKGSPIRNYSAAAGGDSHGPETGSFFDMNRDGLVDWVVAHKDRDRNIIKQTYLNTGQGWASDNAAYHFPNILVDNEMNENNSPMRFGGIMDLNGDDAHDYLMSTKNLFGGRHVATYLGKAGPADLLQNIEDSLGALTSIEYKLLTDTSVYEPSTATSNYNSRSVKGASPVVSDTWTSNGLGGHYQLKYYYRNGFYDGRRGFLGFTQRQVWDPQQKILSHSYLYKDFPVSGMTKQTTVSRADWINAKGEPQGTIDTLSQTSNFIKRVSTFNQYLKNVDRITLPSGQYSYAPRVRRTQSKAYELGQTSPHQTVWSDIEHDAYLNPTQITTVTKAIANTYESIDIENSFSKETLTTYINNETAWILGMPDQVKVIHRAPGLTKQTRLVENEYFTGSGLVRKAMVQPNLPAFTLTTEFRYDDYGNAIETIVSGHDITNRKSTVDYDVRGMHAIKKTNALGHTMTIVPDPKCEAPQSTTDANGLIATISYDQHCRVTRTDYPDGTYASTLYSKTPLTVTQRATDTPDVITYYDELGRGSKVETTGFDGQTLLTEKRYNIKGQITQESLPYYVGDTPQWTQFEYDSIGRLFRTTGADGSISTVDYDGLVTITTNPKGQIQTVTQDLLGRHYTVHDDDNKRIRYHYDAVGNLTQTVDPKGNTIEMGYDIAGRKKWMDDPDMGRWTYQYNVLGELIEQKDAKDQIITTQFDKLGRMTTRTVEPGATGQQISRWFYDSAVNGIGYLDYTTGPNGYRREHSYDTLSRANETVETIDGIELSSKMAYNSDGKVHSVKYPGRQDTFIHLYNDQGYLYQTDEYKVIDGNVVRNPVWVADAMDALGHITQDHYGNGVNITRSYHPTRHYLESMTSQLGSTPVQDLHYTMDAIGNLTRRRDDFQGVTELFEYDNLNRLMKSTTRPYTANPVVIDYDYDVLGNLIYRSDVGTMNYGENGYGPHAITSIQQNSSANITENVYDPYGEYHYDANGNLESNGDRGVTWTAFNKPNSMETRVDGELRKVAYSYGSDFQRTVKSTLSGKYTRYYGGGSMEHITENSQTFYKYYIPIGATTLEIKYEQVDDNGTTTFNPVEKQYLFKDHIGSTDVIVDNDGNIIERLSFNPWGERRDSDWTEADSEVTSSTNRGFTGHEMDDEIGLIYMNARIYDPVIGRFLSPDPIIPSATDLQSYNRYSYVRNNPLSFTDPSGHVPVPGTGGYKYEDGNFYSSYKKYECCYGRGDNYRWNTYYKEVTDPGLIKQLQIRIGVYVEIIENYGGVSRGNAKETRNNARQQAANIIGCPSCNFDYLRTLKGHSREFDAALDREAAASDLYLWLKRQKRWSIGRIGRLAGQIAMQAVVGQVLGPVGNGLLTYHDTGDAKAALISFGAAGANLGISGLDLGPIADTIARGTAGGVVAELSGGDFVDGFAIAGGTVGLAHYYAYVTGVSPTLKPGKMEPGKTDYSYVPDPDTGRIPADALDTNISGINRPLSGNFWDDLLVQGGPVSNVVNYAPTGHGLSIVHDVWLNKLNPSAAAALNWPTMVPAALIHTGGLIGLSPLIQTEIIRQTSQ